ncbi:SpoIIE family protein phosphatase [Flexithrix dorotheae]|uniref:SpoIIE family protein phosphatase n=1 Tax=Flexithrix dorotheae TaxID=70993 RepID=UPI000372F54F|nr:SpoIIE family protein phosphatase [Flexithrix dorotheae]
MEAINVIDKNIGALITDKSKIGDFRRFFELYMRSYHFPENFISDVSIIISELGTNLIKYAKGNRWILCRIIKEDKGVEVISCDNGPHIKFMKKAIEDGFSSSGSLGHGLGSINRLSDQFLYYNSPVFGNSLISRKFIEEDSRKKSALNYDWICVPMQGEDFCGDAVAIEELKDETKILLLDGLGHGPEASLASRNAVKIFKENAQENLVELLQLMDKGIKGSRGCVLGMARFLKKENKLQYIGIGNISAFIKKTSGRKVFISYPGIVGNQVKKYKMLEEEFNKGDTLLMHSDGIRDCGLLNLEPLRNQIPIIMASAIFSKQARINDDSSILVFKNQ